MSNRIKQIFDERHINVSAFARTNGIKATSLYSILDEKTNFERIGIDTFLKIAHGLGMTADELYYGTSPEPPTYTDPRQTALNGHYESLNDESKGDLVKFAKSFASDPERRIEKERQDAGNQIAMGA